MHTKPTHKRRERRITGISPRKQKRRDHLVHMALRVRAKLFQLGFIELAERI